MVLRSKIITSRLVSDARQRTPAPENRQPAAGHFVKDYHRRSERPRSHHQPSPHRPTNGAPAAAAAAGGRAQNSPAHHKVVHVPSVPYNISASPARNFAQQRKHSAPVITNSKPEVSCLTVALIRRLIFVY